MRCFASLSMTGAGALLLNVMLMTGAGALLLNVMLMTGAGALLLNVMLSGAQRSAAESKHRIPGPVRNIGD